MSAAATHAQLRITLVIPDIACGGAQRVASWLANSLAADGGFQVCLLLLCPENAHRAFPLHPGIHVAHANIFWPSTLLRKIPDALRRRRLLRDALVASAPDVVVSFLDIANIWVLLACLGTRLPAVVSERSDPAHSALSPAFRWLRKRLYPRAKAVVIQNQLLLQRWPANWRNLEVIHNPVSEPKGKARATGRTGRNVVLCVARLHPEKGGELLLRAFAMINSDAELRFAGDGPEASRLIALAQELGVADRVVLLGERNDVAEQLAEADIFALASRFEGQPNALAEAMAAGLPVVATDTLGARSLIRHGENGLLVPIGDAQALASELEGLLSSPKRAAHLGANAQQALSAHGEDTVSKAWQALIRRAASGSVHATGAQTPCAE